MLQRKRLHFGYLFTSSEILNDDKIHCSGIIPLTLLCFIFITRPVAHLLHFCFSFHLTVTPHCNTQLSCIHRPFNMQRCAIICIIFSMQLLVVCTLVGATFSSTYSPEEYRGPVENNNKPAKLREFTHQTSEFYPLSLSAPFFRNAILGAAQFEIDSLFRLDARAGGCQCSGLSSKW